MPRMPSVLRVASLAPELAGFYVDSHCSEAEPLLAPQGIQPISLRA